MEWCGAQPDGVLRMEAANLRVSIQVQGCEELLEAPDLAVAPASMLLAEGRKDWRITNRFLWPRQRREGAGGLG